MVTHGTYDPDDDSTKTPANGYGDPVTTEELEARFESLGDLVHASEVIALVQAGRQVWSWGYGDDETSFTTIEHDDLWLFDENIEDATIAWGPFRVEPERDPYDAYGSPEHEAWLIAREQEEG